MLREAPSGAPTWLVVGLGETSVSVGGCTLLVDAPIVLGLGSANATGNTLIPLAIPNHAAFLGLQLHFQGRTVDINGKGRLSNGLIVHMGD